jgi:hypothetical protein
MNVTNADTNMAGEHGAPPGVEKDEAGTEVQTMQGWKKATIAALGVIIVAVLATGIYWSIQPDPFDVEAVALERVGGDEGLLRPGVVAVSSVAKVARSLLDKPGGYLYNDISPPGIYLDNMPSWEYGVLKEVRDSLGALRNDFSRSQTQSIENLELRKADEFLNYNVASWMLPSTESEFRDGIEALDRYLDALIAGDDPSARFYTRADNLAAYLSVVEKRLGSYAQRLSASVGDTELTAGFVFGETEAEDPAPGGGAGSAAGTPWMEIDDVFYEARGYSWALLHMFKALAIEFEPVLRDKNAKVTVGQIIFDLEQATKRMWSPMVLNGHGFGYVANHSLVLGSYISRANAAVLDLRFLLQQG